ncbi:MAG: epoxyqueuosine reductase QueH [Defluviitaleaceae bacterium]|nr:epoxyqueuosine reductase QueH [Defluviitaleaceae bacterium]
MILLHTCCAPCAIGAIPPLREDGEHPVILWHNPNIRPNDEYTKRKNALLHFCDNERLTYIIEENHGSDKFEPSICENCYKIRMDFAAKTAAAKNIPAFTTTLLISPYQNHELIRQIAETAAATHKVAFHYKDFRPHFRPAQKTARQMGIYMQKYCGCKKSNE